MEEKHHVSLLKILISNHAALVPGMLISQTYVARLCDI